MNFTPTMYGASVSARFDGLELGDADADALAAAHSHGEASVLVGSSVGVESLPDATVVEGAVALDDGMGDE